MSYTLGGLTLPRPKAFVRNFVERSAENLTITGITTKRTENRLEIFNLIYQNLTPSQVNSILAIYDLQEVLAFTIDDTNLSIGPVDVLMEINNRHYPNKGESYKENLVVVLKEVR